MVAIAFALSDAEKQTRLDERMNEAPHTLTLWGEQMRKDTHTFPLGVSLDLHLKYETADCETDKTLNINHYRLSVM